MLHEVGTRVAAARPREATLEQVLATDPTRGYDEMLGGARKASQFVRLLYVGAQMK
jgi:hypothetical protein